MGNNKAVDFLLVSGADVNAKDEGGCTPLYWAAYNGKCSTVELLLKKGADKSSMNDQRIDSLAPPFFLAAKNNNKKLVDIFYQEERI